jgi:transcriptional regulator with XRE-family HTH domain
MIESIGKRVASLRQKNGWTQQSLANRLAMSRVAVSHIEMDLTIPSERSITLMAGIFKLSPHELVEGTTYPNAKSERLPELTGSFTEIELQLALLKNDLEWLNRLDNPHENAKLMQEILDKWLPRLDCWEENYHDEHEKIMIFEARQILVKLSSQVNHPRY